MERRLVIAVRNDAAEEVDEMVKASPALANAVVSMEGAAWVASEVPVYATTPLMEACRSHAWRAFDVLAATPGLEVNTAVTRGATTITALADAARRGDTASVRRLLSLKGAGLDVAGSDTAVPHPAVYAAVMGDVALMDAFLDTDTVPTDLEPLLLHTALINGHHACHAHMRTRFLAPKPMSHVAEEERGDKVRLACSTYTRNGWLPRARVGDVFRDLGVPLSSQELDAVVARLVGCGGGWAGGTDACTHIAVARLVAYWLGDEGASMGGSDSGAGTASSEGGATA